MVPYLIQWGQRHPTEALPDVGCHLLERALLHPQPNELERMELDLRNLRLGRSVQPELVASIQTPGGLKRLR
jgi:hypothetical protein